MLALLGAALGLTLLPHLSVGDADVELPVQGDGVRLSLLSRAAAPDTLGVRAGPEDFMLEQARLRVTIGGRRDSAESRQRQGGVMDVLWGNPNADRLELLRTVATVKGELIGLDVRSVLPDVSRSRPALVVVQTNGALHVTTRIELGRDTAEVLLESVAENTGASTIEQVQLGDRVEWPGTPTFAPRVGFVHKEQFAEVPWIAKESKPQSYALVFKDGPASVNFRFDRIGSSENLALGKATTLKSGDSLSYRRSLLVSDRGLAGVSSAVFRTLGKPTGRLRGRVRAAARAATLEVLQGDSPPLTQLELGATGRFEVALPVGKYTLRLSTPGGSDETQALIVQDTTTDVELLAPVAGSLRYSISDSDGRAMPGRLAVRGVAPTKNPDFGSKQRARGVRNVAYSASGQGVLELPPGTYRVWVTRGFEYSIYEQQITVDRDSGASVRAVLKRVLDTESWVGGDFHLHASPSPDSSVPLYDRVVSLAAEGVEFAVATDHNHVTDYSRALEDAQLRRELAASPGIEVTTKRWGHFIAFPYAKHLPIPPYEGVDPGVIFSAIRQSAPGAVIQVNHPRMADIAYFAGLSVAPELSAVPGGVGVGAAASPGAAATSAPVAALPSGVAGARGADDLVKSPAGFSFEFDTIEVVNGFELNKPELVERNIRDWFALLNLGRRYTAVGNSDSHALVHQWAGYPRTYVKVDTQELSALTPEEVASSLLYGRAQISNGIFVDVTANGAAGPGDELTLQTPRVSLRVLVRAAPWVSVDRAELWLNGTLVLETTETAAPDVVNRIQWATELELQRDAWCVVIARGSTELADRLPGAKGKPFAIVNPIFLDADGDGEFTAPLAAAPAAPELVPRRRSTKAAKAGGAPGF